MKSKQGLVASNTAPINIGSEVDSFDFIYRNTSLTMNVPVDTENENWLPAISGNRRL